MHVLIASIDKQQYAFDLAAVQRTLFAVELSPLPNAPDYILGAINLHGALLPVINLRALFALPEKTLSVNDHLICVNEDSPVALWVDHVVRVLVIDDKDLIPGDRLVSELPYIRGAFTYNERLVLLVDLSAVLQLQLQRTGQ